MHSKARKNAGKSLWNVPALTLGLALLGGICVPGLAKTKSATDLSSLPPGAQGPISAALGKSDSGYWVHPSAAGLRGENPRQALVAEFTRQGAEVRSGNLRWRLETRGYGYGDALHPLPAVTPTANANRVEYRRDGITEWYENGPLGLEQGFTLARRPGSEKGQPLTLELSGDLVPALEPGGKSLELRRKDGKPVLRYTGLEARDATGRELRSWLEVRGEQLLLRVQDREALYPVVVDPWIQQAELIASDGKAYDFFGYSVAVSGTTAVVGAPQYPISVGPGVAYVFVESGGKWTQQAELTASDGKAGDQFGYSVAVSGGTVLVGARWHPYSQSSGLGGPGAAYVFVESNGKWSQRAELTPSDGNTFDDFGLSVAISGCTAVVGAPQHTVGSNPGVGAAYAFVENDGKWTQQAELAASDGQYDDYFGNSVALSGSTALVGAPNHEVGSNSQQGAAYVFLESAGKWSQQAELTSSDGNAGDRFGFAVALSGGYTAVAGASGHRVGSNTQQGVAYVFVESAGKWTQQAELTASDGKANDQFGDSVALSGSTVLVGAPNHEVGSNPDQGAAYVFAESAGKWTQQAELTASDGLYDSSFGYSVALSGSTAVVGAPADRVGSNSYQGAAYVFGPPVTVTPASANFGQQKMGTTSQARTFTLTNYQTSELTGIQISTTGDFAVSTTTCGMSLAGNEACTISVTFTPAQSGTRTGALIVKDSATNTPQTSSLTGTGD